MFILPPNCIVPSATSLTISPVFPNFLYFISHTPSAANENCDSTSMTLFDKENSLSHRTIVSNCGRHQTMFAVAVRDASCRQHEDSANRVRTKEAGHESSAIR